MKRSAPLQRTGFARKPPPQPPERPRQVAALLLPMPRVAATAVHIDGQVRAVPKVVPVECEAYRRLVAQLPCRICGREGRSQAAHPNTGKGTGTKTDDRLTFPLCADELGVHGCHYLFDQDALFDKNERRLFERAAGAHTRQQIRLAGLWPAGLAPWPDEQPEETLP